jgi:formyltetrahydrofolate synthetase
MGQRRGSRKIARLYRQDATLFFRRLNKSGIAQDFELHIEDLTLDNGVGFIVAVAVRVTRVSGLPKVPQALFMDTVEGEVVGLS